MLKLEDFILANFRCIPALVINGFERFNRSSASCENADIDDIIQTRYYYYHCYPNQQDISLVFQKLIIL